MTFGRPLNISEVSDEVGLERELVVGDNSANASETMEGSPFPSPETICFLTTTVYASSERLPLDSVKILTNCSRLYEILARILRQIYLDNTSDSVQITSRMLFQNLTGIEEDLARWKATVPVKLSLKPWLEALPGTPAQRSDQQVFSRLSVVTQLRFLNARLLLHRIVLDNTLKMVASGDEVHPPHIRDGFLDKLAISSLEICQDCAMEIITIVSVMSKTKALLGAWWFTIYYSKCSFRRRWYFSGLQRRANF